MNPARNIRASALHAPRRTPGEPGVCRSTRCRGVKDQTPTPAHPTYELRDSRTATRGLEGRLTELTEPRFTDLHNARRFAAEHADVLRYVGKYHRWLVWDGRRWREDQTGEVHRRAKATVQAMYDLVASAPGDDGTRLRGLALAAQRAGRIAGMIELAKSEASFPITPDMLDADPWLFNVENGTLNLRSGELLRHDPAHL